MSEKTVETWPRRPRRLATGVVEDLVDRLVAGEFPAGATLPTEPMLCQTFGVSRTVVREAVKALETMRLVTVQQGNGTRVRDFAEWDLLTPTVLSSVVRHDADLAILEDLVDVRRALEAQMAGQAAVHADEAQRALIGQRMTALEEAGNDVTVYLAADIAFHDAIMAASRNRLGRAMIHTLSDEAHRSMRYIGDPSPEHIRLTNLAHRRVLEAILAGDAELAQTMMDNHIVESWQRRRPPGSAVRDRLPSRSAPIRA